MLKLETHKQFEKDVKKSKKRGKDLKKLWDIVNKLLNKKKLSAKRNSRQKTNHTSYQVIGILTLNAI